MALRSGPLVVVAAAVLWGTAGTAGAVAAADPVPLAAARLVLGGAVLASVAALMRSRRANHQVTARGKGRLPWGQVLAAGAVAGYQLCFFAAVQRTGVAIGTVVAIGSGPVFTGLLSWLTGREPPSRRWIFATAAAIAGCAVLVWGGVSGGVTGGADPWGIALALLGGLLYAFYAVVASQAIGRGTESAIVMGVMFGGAAVIMLPVLLVTGAGGLAHPRGLLATLYLGCATTALAYLLYGRGLRTTPVATAATLALAEPAVAALLGLVVLHEHLSPLSWGGLALLGLSLAVVALPGGAVSGPAERVPAHLGSVP
jgi:DME family drug/metabolite transporter